MPRGSCLTSPADAAEILVQDFDLTISNDQACLCCAAVKPGRGERSRPWIGRHNSDSNRREDQLSDEPSDEHQRGPWTALNL